MLSALPGAPALAAAARGRGRIEVDESDELTVSCLTPADALDLALDLRRWSVHGRCGSPSLRVGVAAHSEREPLAAAQSRARRLAESLEAGELAVERSLEHVVERRHALTDPAGKRGSPRLTWLPGEDVRDPIPPPVSIALDRSWPMLGRGAQLVEVGEAWGRTVEGAGGAVLIAGEPGIGKSRLLAEAVAEVHTGGGTILMGTEGEVPAASFGSFGAALSQLRTLRPELLDEPSVARALEHLKPSDPDSPRDGKGGLGDERAVLFDHLAGVFELLCSRQPTLLAVEDLHAGDDSSLALFGFLLRRAIPRLLIVATYRSTEIEAGTDQERLLTDIRSAPGVKHLALSGLPARVLGDLADSLGGTVTADEAGLVAARLEDETRGNPLYASELLRRAIEIGGELSVGRLGQATGTLGTLLEERAAALGEPGASHLRAASLAGRRFAPDLVARALGTSQREFDASLLAAQRSGLVLPAGDGQYEFSHALTARCLADTLPPEEAGRLHRALAESIEDALGAAASSRAPSLARHWSLAAPPAPERALHYVRLAGERALAGLDHERAARWFERGLELHSEIANPDLRQRCDLLLGLGRARRYRGADFRDTLLEAGRIAAELGDDTLLAAAALSNTRGFVSAAGHFDRERAALLELALERMGEQQLPERALALAQLSLEITFTGEDRRRRQLADQALRAARSAGDERLLARVLIRRLIALWGPTTLDERIVGAAESAGIATRLDEPLDLFHGLHWQGMALIEAGRIADAARLLNESATIAARLGDLTALWLAEFGRTSLLMLRGELDAAEASANAALALGQEGKQPDALPFYASQIAAVRWHQGRLGELTELLARALEENPGIQGLRSLVVLALAISGERQRAIGELAVDASMAFEEVPRDPIWLPVMVTYGHAVAELAAAGGNDLRPVARDLESLLAPFGPQLASTTVSIWGLVSHCLGRLAAVRGEHGVATERLEHAIASYERLGAPVWRGMACSHLAEVRMRLRDSGGAVASAERLRAEAVQVGLAHDAHELLRVSGQAANSGRVPLVDGASELGLSERETEVARLAAAGLSNAVIGEQLNISPSTVKHHLQSAYRQLGVRGRGELAHRILDDSAR